jgi:hypothetical protein
MLRAPLRTTVPTRRREQRRLRWAADDYADRLSVLW